MYKIYGTWNLLKMEIFKKDNLHSPYKSISYPFETAFISFNPDGFGMASTLNSTLTDEKIKLLSNIKELNDLLFFSVAYMSGEKHDSNIGEFIGKTIMATTPRGKGSQRKYQYERQGNQLLLNYEFKEENSLFDFNGLISLTYQKAELPL